MTSSTSISVSQNRFWQSHRFRRKLSMAIRYFIALILIMSSYLEMVPTSHSALEVLPQSHRLGGSNFTRSFDLNRMSGMASLEKVVTTGSPHYHT